MTLKKFRSHFIIEESDVTIITDREDLIRNSVKNLIENREIIKRTIKKDIKFQKSFKPYFVSEKSPPEIIESMQNASEICNVGPMAAVAGALADLMCDTLKKGGAQIAVVENGGEIAIDSKEDIFIALYSMTTILKANIGFLFKGGGQSTGVGTSSGTFGHAVSFGEADTVTVFANNASIGDAAATRVANEVKGDDVEGSVGKGLEIADSLDKVRGVFITRGEYVGKSGNIPELVSVEKEFENNYVKSKFNGDLSGDLKFF